MNFLTRTQEKTINLLSHSPLRDKFYWTGGTLLAYHYLQHRKSYDLDFFSEKKFSFDEVNHFVEELKKTSNFKKIEYQKIFDRWEFLLENSQILRVEFVYYNSEKKTLRKRGKLLGVYIDSLEDIAANKVIAYFDRNEPKDLFDIYFLIKKAKFTPQRLLSLAYQKFGVKFTESLFWSEAFKGFPQLSDLKPMMFVKKGKKEELIKKIKDYFKEESVKYLKQMIES